MTAPATHLTWSDEIGKRVRTGDWTDQYERIGRTKPALPVIQPGPGR